MTGLDEPGESAMRAEHGAPDAFGVLTAIARRFATVSDLSTLARLVEQEIERVVEVEYSGFYLFEEGPQRVRLLWARGFTEEERRVAEETALERHPGWVFRHHRMLDVPDTAAEDLTVSSPRRFVVRSRLYYPVLHLGCCYGAVGLGSLCPNAFTDAHRRLLSYVCTIAGITYANVLHAERLEALAEAKFETLVATATDGILITDVGFRLDYSNRRLQEALGRDTGELTGLPLLDLVAGESRARARTVMREAESGVAARDVEIHMIHAGGHAVDFELSLVPLVRDGRFEGAFANLRDITERKQFQEELARADRLASVGLLAAGVGHEINNPLCYILGNQESLSEMLDELKTEAELLRAKILPQLPPEQRTALLERLRVLRDPDRLREAVEMAREATEGTIRIGRIVRDLKTFARVDESEREAVDVNRALDAALSMAHNELSCRAIVSRRLGRVPPVSAEFGRLAQVFLNLLINAAHAIEDGRAAENEVRLVTRADGRWVIVEIRDTGCGIPKEHLARIFDPFFSTKPSERGSGLGMWVSQGIVESLGGGIEVETRPGRGTTIRVRLPAAAEDTSRTVEAPPHGEEPTAPRCRVLIADDEPAIRRMLERILRDEHDVVLAGSGVEAMEILRHDGEFDLVLCDMVMSSGSGIDVHRWLEAHRPRLASRLIFFTGGAFTPAARKYLARSSVPTLDKPVDRQRLRDLVRSHARVPAPDVVRPQDERDGGASGR